MKKKLLVLTGMAACVFGMTACGNGENLGEAMEKAGLNTLLGMGTVFVVLILISLIISCFGVIPRLQKAFSRKADEGQDAARESAAAQRQEQETAQSQELAESDDGELVAVIAAAIAASEGAASADGFVVRSIIRRP